MTHRHTKIIVAGVLRLRPGTFDELRPFMLRMIEASRAEAGCLAYSYAVDLMEPRTIRVYEEWQDRAALEAHFASPHLKSWRSALSRIGIEGRELHSWTAADPRPV